MENLESFGKLLILLTIILIGFYIKRKNNKIHRKKKHPQGIKSYTEKGEMVKSKAEARIANFLNKKRINYVYEKPLTLEKITLKPDFYLPTYNTYIEFFGLYNRNLKYTESAKKKRKLYRRNNIKVIELFPEDYRRLEDELNNKLIFLRIFHVLKSIIKGIKSLFN